MRKFIVFGRGRSGTTVVADELSRHPQIALPSGALEHGGRVWDRIEPFAHCPAPDAEGAEEVVRRWGQVPLVLWAWLNGRGDTLQEWAEYLDDLEAWGEQQEGAKAVGFKIIDNQLLEREGLIELLAERRYVIINLHRRNVVRHALSGLLARARGVFNERNYRDTGGPYPIDGEEFEQAIGDIRHWVEHWDHHFRNTGIRALDVYYEDFLSDRGSFYAGILQFLGLDPGTPETSDYSRMVPKDLSQVIENYEEIRLRCMVLGLHEMLEQF